MTNAKLMQAYVKTHPLPEYVKKVGAPAQSNNTQSLAKNNTAVNSTASFKTSAPTNNSTQSFTTP